MRMTTGVLAYNLLFTNKTGNFFQEITCDIVIAMVAGRIVAAPDDYLCFFQEFVFEMSAAVVIIFRLKL